MISDGLLRDAPAVSIVIPVRNGKEYIHESIDGILAQSFGDFEILVMDDGSDDFDYSTLQDRDPRIRVIRLAGEGVSCARNAGMKLARGRFIAFQDADDFWFPGKLAAQIAYFENHPEAGVVFGGFVKWTQGPDGAFPPAASLATDCSGFDRADPERSGWLYTRLLMGLLVGMNTAVIRRAVYARLGGFDESMRIGEDYDYWLRASRITQMHALDGPVALYRIHGASAMARLNAENHLAALLRVARLRWGLMNADGTSISEHEFDLRMAAAEFSHGYAHYRNGDVATARRAFTGALRRDHSPVRTLAYLVLCWIRFFLPKGN